MQNITNAKTKIINLPPNYFDKNHFPEKQITSDIAHKISEQTGLPLKHIWSGDVPDCRIINWYNIEGQWFYFKWAKGQSCIINELMGEVISKYFALDTAHYILAKLGNKEGVISQNFCCKDFSYKTSRELNFTGQNNLDIINKIKENPTLQKKDLLLEDIKKLFIRDFYTIQNDRNNNNLLFKCQKNSIRMAPLFDYEMAFDHYTKFQCYRNVLGTLYLDFIETRQLVINDDFFQKLLLLLMDARMPLFIQEVEDTNRIKIPEYLKEKYLQSDLKVKRYVKDSKVTR